MTDKKLYQGSRGNNLGMNINGRIMLNVAQQHGKTAIMIARMKQWCKDNPGKKALLTGILGSQVLTYDAGSKVFIYSPVKLPLEPTITIDEAINNWNAFKTH